MKNKVKYKKAIILSIILTLVLLVIFILLNYLEYLEYTVNTNYKLNSIISSIKSQYPKVSDQEIIEIFNSKNNQDYFLKYGILIDKDNVIKENTQVYYKYFLIETLILIIMIYLIIRVYLKYNKNKSKELLEIAKYLEEINNKNYTLNIEDYTEDELSILKSELYKVTVRLKEAAENSKQDKLELKTSLEDISHQLKTPLTSILIMLDNVIDNEDMPKSLREEFLRDIKREIFNINFLVQNILKLSKFESNTITFVKDKYNIKDIIEESIHNVVSISDLKNIKINILNKEDYYLLCDYHWEVEALTNILKNSLEYSYQNSEVAINYLDNKVYLKVDIINYGVMIKEEDLPHIFERFYTKNNNKDSMGIGLSLSKKIIEKDNGSISVNSKDSKTIFTIKYFKY